MEQKEFYYFGLIKYEGKKRSVVWGKPYPTAEACVMANVKFMSSHVGRDFMIQKFDHELSTTSPA